MSIDRKSKSYEVVCPSCKEARFVTYAQHWNIETKKCSGRCIKCPANLNMTGLKKGHGWNKGLRGFRKGHPPYFVALGEKNPAWKGGITSVSLKIRNSKKYAEWRTSVFERDNYTCVWCSQKGGKLCADHIKPFSLFPNLRFDLENGRTLCLECHKQTDMYLSKIFSYGRISF